MAVFARCLAAAPADVAFLDADSARLEVLAYLVDFFAREGEAVEAHVIVVAAVVVVVC